MRKRLPVAIPNGPLVRVFRNLIGVPSRHHDGVYGRAAREVIAQARPDVVALELPECVRRELEWAAACWPGPVASIADSGTLPFVPGDSILEAFRAGRKVGARIELIDLAVGPQGQQEHEATSPVPGPMTGPEQCAEAGSPEPRQTRGLEPACTVDSAPLLMPGSELARRVGPPFFEVSSGLVAKVAPDEGTLAREAAMARRLAGLMADVPSVLWVGGLMHWERIVARLETEDFESPEVPALRPSRFQRARLSPSALCRLTGQWPWLVARFARAPSRFDPVDAARTLLHQAVHARLDRRVLPPESRSTIDVARVGLYARNLAATDGVRELPDLAELLLAAKAVIGDRYAVRVYLLALSDHPSRKTRALPALTWEADRRSARAGFRFGDRWLTIEPWFPPDRPYVELPDLDDLRRAADDAHYEALPGPRPGDRYFWGAYPPDEAEYETFVQYLLRRASVADPGEARSLPFTAGLADGLDARATIRHWHEDTIYVREEQRGQMNVTNGVIDWTSATEGSDVLQGRAPHGGWNDPDSPHVGSVSREVEPYERLLQRGHSEVTLRHREWSALTLDCPTYLDHPEGRPTFWDAVIEPLLAFERRGEAVDNLYAWFEVMCRFCAGKPLVYYSRYLPGPHLHAIARAHDVRLVWSPLQRLPQSLVARHRTFRQLHLSEHQWEVLKGRLAAAKTGQVDVGQVLE